MTAVDTDDFHTERDCIYDGERYSVRDNGSVFRHSRPNKRQRSLDAQWTFGKANDKNGYMEIASVRIHRIVATAFHGIAPTPEHVVDHIDTNRRNNRPENLRWLTRLENVLKNPITVKRIEFICGSVEAFLADPSQPLLSDLEPHLQWMRTVSQEEAKACLERMHLWVKSDKPPSGGSLGEWIFKPITAQDQLRQRTPKAHASIRKEPIPAEQRKWDRPHEAAFTYSTPKFYEDETDLVMAKTSGAAQRNWRVPSEFPCCPRERGKEPVATYATRLEAGVTFARNQFSETVVVASALTNDRQSLWVMCENVKNEIKPWALAQITFEDGLYVHTSRGSFFDVVGAEKAFCLAQGLEWTGGDSIDDYC